jgi:Na+/H+ antiporter NhaC
MLMGIIVLVLAWSLSAVATSLGTADYLVALLGDAVPPAVLPTLVFLLACAIAFATGTSWGTMGILMPLVVPLTWAIAGGDADATALPIFHSAIACVLVGGVAIACGTLPAGFGMPWWLGLVLGSAALWVALRLFGRDG